jgi:CBS domain-containing protein
MTRRDAHLDAMLTHLGAAYYDSLLGRASPADVTRAMDSVAAHFGEGPPHREDAAQQPYHGPQHHGRWHSRVGDVMTTSVVTADRLTPYKDIAERLAQHQVSGLPVLVLGRHVAGVVSEGDLIRARDQKGPPRRGHGVLHQPHLALTAGQLMTSPAITVRPETPVARGARLMNSHHIRRLPVVDADGKLAGIVSRRDLLGLFLRPDGDIARQVGEVLAEILPEGQDGIEVTVHDGLVTLAGPPELAGDRDLLPAAIRLIWDIDGVIDLVTKIGHEASAKERR